MALGSWFSQIWRAAGPEIAAIAAVASGNPQLAIPASQAAAATIKPKKPPAPLQPPLAVGPGAQGGGFVAAYQGLPQGDKNAIMIGGTVLGAVLLSRLLAPASGRR